MTALSSVKRLLVGRPLPTAEQEHQRLAKIVALAVFSSDAISSTAYATEEILHVLIPRAGFADALAVLVPISLVVCALLAIVVTSYSQTIHAYPSGGGAYVVSRENLGVYPSLIAAGSLLVDYILTVAVSISAGAQAIVSAFPSLNQYRVELCLVLIAIITLANLRGVRESGRAFAVPTYAYIFALGALIGWGLYRSFTGSLAPLAPVEERIDEFTKNGSLVSGLTLFLLARAFSSGAVALTGVEAISNGVPAFRRPAARNASITLTWMAVILGGYFFGLSVLAHRLAPTPFENADAEGYQTLLSIMGNAVFGGGFFYFLLQASTAAILVLAANTAYADFPRLSSIIASDGFLPRQLMNRGDRLVFSNGILVLAFVAGGLVVAFNGDTSALIPLYAVGVFLSFTLSQTGMVRHHLKLRETGWRRNIVINGVGAVATFIVLIDVLVTKFTIGAWVPTVLIPLIVLAFLGVHRHYMRVRTRLHVAAGWKPPPMNHTVVVLVSGVHTGVLQALAYARSLHPNHLVAVSVVSDDDEQARIEAAWAKHQIEVPLEIVYSPYRELTRPILRYLDDIDARWSNDIVTVVVPEFVVTRWWEQLLHNQSALFLKGRLLFRRGTVVTSVPYHLD
jgi:amino acid transporter